MNIRQVKQQLLQLNYYQIIAVALAVMLVIGAFYAMYMPVNLASSEKVKIKIEKGQTLTQVARMLKENNLIQSRQMFVLYVRMNGQEHNLKAGTYSFTKAMNTSEIAEIIIGGFTDKNDYQILLAEGYNMWEIDKRLSEYKMGKLTEFAKKYIDKEGYLFPDTYLISRPDDENFDLNIVSDAVAARMMVAFDEKAVPLLASLSAERQKEVIIIASMLEKEARTEEDMRLVSGIIHERLNRGMLLQIDATVAYGACIRDFKLSNQTKNCDVTQVPIGKEIRIDGPYNSYMQPGLPVGPIANPGLKSIKAALNPKESPYLYYLSTRDGSSIIYSRTGAEHEANRSKYLGL